MKVEFSRVFPGVNFYTFEPSVVAELDLGEMGSANVESYPGFGKRVTELFPGLDAHSCKSVAGSKFIDLLNDGMRWNHVIEHLVIELLHLSDPAGDVKQECCITRTPNRDRVVVQTNFGEAARYLIPQAVQIVDDLIHKRSVEIADTLNKSREIMRDSTFSQKGLPANEQNGIPIIAITGTNGKTTVTRLVSHILRTTGKNIGTATTDGILTNGETVEFGDTTGPSSAKTILDDPMIDIAVLETARGGILRRGLGWDWADIGVVTNITEDHIGQDGIESVSDLIEIKSLIAERVREGGTLILNADDEGSAGLAARPAVLELPRNIIYFSTREISPKIQEHIAHGGTAYVLQNNWICEASHFGTNRILDVMQIPLTISGTAEYQVQNIMAAIAVARTIGLENIAIKQAVRTFNSAKDNKGRSNIYRVNNSYVVIDYGHNPKAIESVCKMIAQWGMRRTGIISFPGDRSDDVIESSARISANGFDRIIVKGDQWLRGRNEGEVGAMMLKAIAESGCPVEAAYEGDGIAAFEREVSVLDENNVLVFFYEKIEPILAILEKFGAVATEDVRAVSAAAVGDES